MITALRFGVQSVRVHPSRRVNTGPDTVRASSSRQGLLRAAIEHKLTNVLGRRLGPEYYRELCRDLGLEDVTTPDEALRFANALIEQGGLLASVGRSVRSQAIMCGAIEP